MSVTRVHGADSPHGSAMDGMMIVGRVTHISRLSSSARVVVNVLTTNASFSVGPVETQTLVENEA